MNFRNRKFWSLASTVSLVVVALVVGIPTANAISPYKELPSVYEAELKAAKRISFGKTISLTACTPESFLLSPCTKIVPLKVRIGKITYNPPGDGVAAGVVFSVPIKLQNLTSSGGGVIPRIRCSNAREIGQFYGGGDNTSFIPPRSQLTGVVLVGFPEAPSGGVSLKPTQCKDTVIWLLPNNPNYNPVPARSGMVTAAYIPLPPSLLAALESKFLPEPSPVS